MNISLAGCAGMMHTQEVASLGMGLVYEMSEEAGSEELVEMLVGTLMEGRKYVQHQ